MTELDQALTKYLQDEDEQDQYYELVLKTDFYIPLSMESAATPAAERESVTPLILTSEEKHYMLLFDSEERLTQWAKKPIDFVVLAGFRAAAISTPELHWAVNVGGQFAKEFLPEEIAWLKETVG